MSRKNSSDYEEAAKAKPKDRTDAQRDLVADAHKRGMQTITNLDHSSTRRQRQEG